MHCGQTFDFATAIVKQTMEIHYRSSKVWGQHLFDQKNSKYSNIDKSLLEF